MYVLGMTKHIRQILEKERIFTPLLSKMLKIPLMMTLLHQKFHGNHPSKGIYIPTDKFYSVNSASLHLSRSSRHQNTPRLPSNTSNHSMTPMLNPHQKPQRRQSDGPIYLHKSIYIFMNEESKEALKKYNLEALQMFQNRKYKRLYVVLMTLLLIQVQN